MSALMENKAKTIEEKDVIDFLLIRRKMLVHELNKIDNTIDVLNSSGKILLHSNDLSTKKVSRNTGKSDDSDKTPVGPLRSVESYDVNAKLDDKIAAALLEIKNGSREDIIDFISHKEPTIKLDKLRTSLSVRLSNLLRGGRIVGSKHGKTYIYSLT